MLNNKFIITLLTLIFAVFVYSKNNTIKEDFINDSTFKIVTECQEVENDNVSNALKANIFKVPGTFQSVDSRRVMNLRGGAHLKLHNNNTKNIKENYAPCANNSKPNLHNIVKENYSSCGNNSKNVPSVEHLNPSQTIDDSIIELPPNDMTLPKEKNVKCISRLMFASKKSRTRAQGCPIRGDLPIMHNKSKNGWFQVSANPTIDLHHGGIFGISGHHDEKMASLMKKGGKTASGGGDISNLGVNNNTLNINIENFP